MARVVLSAAGGQEVESSADIACETKALVGSTLSSGARRQRRWMAGAVATAVVATCSIAAVVRWRSTWSEGSSTSDVDDTVGLHYDTGLLKWEGVPEKHKCLNVEMSAANDQKHYVGALIQVWQCIPGDAQFIFVFPRTHGAIRWAKDPRLCVRAQTPDAGAIDLWPCNTTDELTDWTMPPALGPIRLTAHPTKCISEINVREPQPVSAEPGTDAKLRFSKRRLRKLQAQPRTQNGVKAHLGECPLGPGVADQNSDWSEHLMMAEGQLQRRDGDLTCLRAMTSFPGSRLMMGFCADKDHNQFVFPARFGLIRWNPFRDLCVAVGRADLASVGVGGPTSIAMGLTKCNETHPHMIWEMPNGDGPVRLKEFPNVCIAPAGVGEYVKAGPCGYEADPLATPAPDIVDEVFHDPTDVVHQGEKSWANETFNVKLTDQWEGGFPSLYCIAVIRPWGYERDVMSTLLEKAEQERHDFGIFACDDFDLFSQEKFKVGRHHLKGDVWTVWFQQAWVGVSKDHTAANAQLFMNLWNQVKQVGVWDKFDWTVKVDPDAVVLPDRIREHIKPFNWHSPQFIENCNAFHGPDYPMVFGAVEVFSREAMQRYYSMEWRCRQMDWRPLGEDVYMRRCMVMMGVAGRYDANLVGDQLCTYKNCGEGWKASFHPLKSVGSWLGCWYQATR